MDEENATKKVESGINKEGAFKAPPTVDQSGSALRLKSVLLCRKLHMSLNTTDETRATQELLKIETLTRS